MPEHFDFVNEFGEIGARCAGAKSFLAEIENQAIAAGALFIYDGAALLGAPAPFPKDAGKARKLLCSTLVCATPPNKTADQL